MRLEKQGQILKKAGAPGRQTVGGRSRQAVHTKVWAARQQAGERWGSGEPERLSTQSVGRPLVHGGRDCQTPAACSPPLCAVCPVGLGLPREVCHV